MQHTCARQALRVPGSIVLAFCSQAPGEAVGAWTTLRTSAGAHRCPLWDRASLGSDRVAGVDIEGCARDGSHGGACPSRQKVRAPSASESMLLHLR